VKNNGHTVQITLDPIPLRPTMTNTLATKVGRTAETAPQTWRLEQLHFHWGRKGKKNEGSEHYLLNRPYTMEGHFVHYNAKYADVAAAVASGNKDALLVVGVMFQVGATATGGTLVADIASSIAAITTTEEVPLTTAKGSFAELAARSGIASSCDPNCANFFAYPGSLTTPTCNEDVTWVVMEAPMTVTQVRLAILNAVK
jgi:carbonic anhydrase